MACEDYSESFVFGTLPIPSRRASVTVLASGSAIDCGICNVLFGNVGSVVGFIKWLDDGCLAGWAGWLGDLVRVYNQCTIYEFKLIIDIFQAKFEKVWRIDFPEKVTYLG